jgi:uncharacterized DUF497 family protein
MRFEWDEEKNRLNLEKHGLSFEDCEPAFLDERRITTQDTLHSQDEERYYCIGNNGKGIITVRFTVHDGIIRIFGAGYWRKGKKHYERRNQIH